MTNCKNCECKKKCLKKGWDFELIVVLSGKGFKARYEFMRFISRKKFRSVIKKVLYVFVAILLFFGVESWALSYGKITNKNNRIRHHQYQELATEIKRPSKFIKAS